jgi:hypothetical protein
MAGFAPDFAGFCTQLENSINNTISCDCTNAVGGSYNISCTTNDRICSFPTTDDDENDIHCGKVNSTVAVMDGTIHTVTACAAYDTEPFTSSSTGTSGVTCTTMHLCRHNHDDDNTNSSQEQVCHCSVTYDHQSCNACTVLRQDASTTTPTLYPNLLPDTTYITIDCSNVNENAITDIPQPIYGSNSYEFLPYYNRMIRNDTTGISFDNHGDSKSNSHSYWKYQYMNTIAAMFLVTAILTCSLLC